MISIDVKGLDSLERQLLEIGAETGAKKLAQAARKAFKPIVERAKLLVPVSSGALRDSLRVAVAKPKSGGLVVAVGMRVASASAKQTEATSGKEELPPGRRWHWVELGTVKMPARPFARPALDEGAVTTVGILKDELAKGIARAVKAKSRGR